MKQLIVGMLIGIVMTLIFEVFIFAVTYGFLDAALKG